MKSFIMLHSFLISIMCAGQDKGFAQHVVFFEILGAGGYYSINYDRILSTSDKITTSIRCGLSVTFPDTNHIAQTINRVSHFNLPITINAFWGKTTHHLEIGLGVTVSNGFMYNEFSGDWSKKTALTPVGFFGYRYQKMANSAFFRIGYSPFYEFREDWLIHWVGVGIGYAFST